MVYVCLQPMIFAPSDMFLHAIGTAAEPPGGAQA